MESTIINLTSWKMAAIGPPGGGGDGGGDDPLKWVDEGANRALYTGTAWGRPIKRAATDGDQIRLFREMRQRDDEMARDAKQRRITGTQTAKADSLQSKAVIPPLLELAWKTYDRSLHTGLRPPPVRTGAGVSDSDGNWSDEYGSNYVGRVFFTHGLGTLPAVYVPPLDLPPDADPIMTPSAPGTVSIVVNGPPDSVANRREFDYEEEVDDGTGETYTRVTRYQDNCSVM
jgi:hypothetical protein